MTITLFQRRNFGGDPEIIRRNQNNLGEIPLGHNPSSITMDANDAILLFRNRNWRGGVMYLRGENEINNLGSPAAGGRRGFGNSISSVRVSPFILNLNVTVVGRSDGELPGGRADFDTIRGEIRTIIRNMNTFFNREDCLLLIREAQINLRVNNNHFNLGNMESLRFPGRWKNPREVDMIFVNSFDSGAFGQGMFPWFGKTTVVSYRGGGAGGNVRNLDQLSKTAVHEIGHYLGSRHVAAADDPTNIMVQGTQEIGDRTATPEQIRGWHQRLSRNPTRRRDRA